MIHSESILKIKNVSKKNNSQDCFVNFTNGNSEVLSLDLVMKYNLTKDKQIANTKLERIISENRIIIVKKAAYNYANYKPRTIAQVKLRLKQKDFTSIEINTALDFLEEFNLVDDRKYAEMFLEEIIKKKPSGKAVIIAELRKKGIDNDIATETISRLFSDDELPDMAYQAAEKKMRMLRHKPLEKQKSSMIVFLQRKGFDWDTINQTLPRFFKEED